MNFRARTGRPIVARGALWPTDPLALPATVSDITPILDSIPGVKSPREIALIRRASQIAGQGMLEAIRAPGQASVKYEHDAAARYVSWSTAQWQS